MKKNVKKLKSMITIMILLLGILLLVEPSSQAALQSNPTTHASPKQTTGSDWIQTIREMEKSGQTMGLNETVNADLTSVTSNNIDVHMMRSTEYGAMAILSASGFGWERNIS